MTGNDLASTYEFSYMVLSRNLAELLRWWEQGKLKPLIAKTFPVAEAGAALNALLSRHYAGKVVLEV